MYQQQTLRQNLKVINLIASEYKVTRNKYIQDLYLEINVIQYV